MRRTLSRLLFVLTLFFVLRTAAFAQNPDPQPTPDPNAPQQPAPAPRNDDIEETRPAPPPDDSAPPAIPQSLDGDRDSADLPPFAQGLTDTERYFRMRDEHIRFLRGLMDKHFDPRARGQAIRDTKDKERTLRESIGRGRAGGANAPGNA